MAYADRKNIRIFFDIGRIFQMLDGIVTYFQKRNAKGQKNQALGIVRRFLVHLQR
jgi:hypothetical protein